MCKWVITFVNRLQTFHCYVEYQPGQVVLLLLLLPLVLVLLVVLLLLLLVLVVLVVSVVLLPLLRNPVDSETPHQITYSR